MREPKNLQQRTIGAMVASQCRVQCQRVTTRNGADIQAHCDYDADVSSFGFHLDSDTASNKELRELTMHHVHFLGICLVLLLSACVTSDKPRFIESGYHPVLKDGASAIVDVCIKYDTLSSDEDYFLAGESERLAAQLTTELGRLLSNYHIDLAAPTISLVCGARHLSPAKPSKVAQTIGAVPILETQPFSGSMPFRVELDFTPDAL
jgi:hypothetical protein